MAVSNQLWQPLQQLQLPPEHPPDFPPPPKLHLPW
jgi:hypothetical protein